MSTTPGTGRGDADGSARTVWMVGSAFVVAIGIVGAWMALSSSKTATIGGPDGERRAALDLPAKGKTYLPAKHIDPATARLSAAAGGKATLEFVIRGVADGDHLVFTARDPADKSDMMVFVRKGDATTTIGNLAATTAGTGNPAEATVKIDLDRLPRHLTVIDLRWDGGKWEGFEVAAPAGGSPR